MAHAQKPDFVFRRNRLVHLNRRGRQFSRLLAAEVWASAVVMLDTTCSEVVWRVLATHSIRQFPLFPSRPSQCGIKVSAGLYQFWGGMLLFHKVQYLRTGVSNYDPVNVFAKAGRPRTIVAEHLWYIC